MAELPPPEIAADEARQIADRVLSGRAYVEANRPPSFFEWILEWVGTAISDLLQALSSSGDRGLAAWVVIGLFGAIIIFLLVKLVGKLGGLSARPASPELLVDVDSDSNSTDWRARAAAAEASADWRTAIRCHHRALVTTMIERRIVTARPGQTAGEIDRVVGAAFPGAAEDMQQATRLFKDAWYGWVEADRARVDEFVAAAARVAKITQQGPVEVSDDPLERAPVRS